jgi:hypothetical protein
LNAAAAGQASDQEAGSDQVEEPGQRPRRLVQAQSDAGHARMLRGAEEGIEPAEPAVGDRREVYVDRTDAVMEASFQCFAQQGHGVRLEVTDQGHQGGCWCVCPRGCRQPWPDCCTG